LTTLTTYCDLVSEVREKVLVDALAAGRRQGAGLSIGGTDAAAYADGIATYLGLAVSRTADLNNTLVTWSNSRDQARNLFARQALSMSWDFVEVSPFARAAGDVSVATQTMAMAIPHLPTSHPGEAVQFDAPNCTFDSGVLCTDPPYYDNIGYSDLSDFFYVWLRQSLRTVWPDLFATMLVPKKDELVANPFRHDGTDGARKFFEEGFTTFFARARRRASIDFPITVFYAFKQSDSTVDGIVSSGWETLLEGMVQSRWMITGTWPMRSERGGRTRAIDSNTLASSIVLALRPRSEGAPTADRRGFITALQAELPGRLRELQQGAIAPVDLPQAAIGPGMAVFTRYAKVIESDGSAMGVRSALARINEVLDEVLSEQEGDFDATTRFAISWYRQHGYDAGAFGAADNMARARNTSVAAMERAGILTGRAGKVALLSPARLSASYEPVADVDISAWEVLHHLIRIIDADGVPAAGAFLSQVGTRADSGIDPALVKELAFLLFSVADAKKWAKDAIAFNNIATSWTDLIDASRSGSSPSPADFTLDFATDEEEV
jgi:putative DNA methylase